MFSPSAGQKSFMLAEGIKLSFTRVGDVPLFATKYRWMFVNKIQTDLVDPVQVNLSVPIHR